MSAAARVANLGRAHPGRQLVVLGEAPACGASAALLLRRVG